MSLLDKIFGKKQDAPSRKEVSSYFKTLTGYAPVFTSFNGAIYEVQQVRSAINICATHISKLKVEIKGSSKSISHAVLVHRPNSFNTWSQFLYRLATILYVQNTAFIVPILDAYGRTVGIYPVLPSKCEIVEFNNVMYLRYTFKNGQRAAIEFDKCGIMNKFQYKDDFFGEKNSSLNPTLSLIDINNQGIREGIKSSATYRFMAKMTNFTKEEDLKREREKFNKASFQDEGGGLLLFPNTYSDIKQIDSKPFTISDKQMELIDNNICNYFGVNKDVLQNSAYGDKWSAFYEGVVEAFAIQFSEVLTNMLFTDTEKSNGNIVMATANRLQYMSNQEKLNVSSQLSDRGILNRDEVREIWNLPPLPNNEGKKYIIRGEYKEANEQLGNSNDDDK